MHVKAKCEEALQLVKNCFWFFFLYHKCFKYKYSELEIYLPGLSQEMGMKQLVTMLLRIMHPVSLLRVSVLIIIFLNRSNLTESY